MRLQTCPCGHETCWPEACPVCRSIYLGRRIRLSTQGEKIAAGLALSAARLRISRAHAKKAAAKLKMRDP